MEFVSLFLLLVSVITGFLYFKTKTSIKEVTDKYEAEHKDNVIRLAQLEKDNSAMIKQATEMQRSVKFMQSKVTNLEQINEDLVQDRENLKKEMARIEDLQKVKELVYTENLNEIKNAVGFTKNAADLLKSYDTNLQHQKKMIENMFETSDKIIRASNEIATMIATDLVIDFLKTSYVNPAVLVKPIVERNRLKASKKSQDLFFEPDVKLPDIQIEPEKIAEALENLIDNAIKFSPLASKIHVVIRQEKDFVCFEVIDGGQGINDADIELAFERGSKLSTQSSNSEAGAGLGLWMTKKIVKQHGGKVYIKRGLMSGACIGFKLPF